VNIHIVHQYPARGVVRVPALEGRRRRPRVLFGAAGDPVGSCRGGSGSVGGSGGSGSSCGGGGGSEYQEM
jgi:hypothetical protein